LNGLRFELDLRLRKTSAAALGVVAMAIAALDRAVLSSDDELGFLIAADLASEPLGLLFRCGAPACTFATIAFHLPPTVFVRHHPMSVCVRHKFFPLRNGAVIV